LLWANAIGHIISGSDPDDLDLFGGVEFGDFLDEGWCGGKVVEDEGEVGFEVEEVGFELGRLSLSDKFCPTSIAIL
jgi:hypothetical protein